MKPTKQETEHTPAILAAALKASRRGIYSTLFFSLCINVLLLAAPLYMLQVFDRVISSGSTDTLIYLTIITLSAVAVMAALEAVRGRVMLRLGTWLENLLSRPVFETSVELAARSKQGASIQGLRDVATLRNFLTGPGLFPIMDAPWVPIFLAIIFLLHPTLGFIATGGAIALFALAILNDRLSREALQGSNEASVEGLRQAEAAVRNADAVLAMGISDNLNRRWSKSNGDALDMLSDASNRSGLLSALSKFLRLGLQVAMMGAGAWLVLGAELTAGGMVAGSILLGRALAPVDQAIGSWKGAIAARVAYDRVKLLLAAHTMAKESIELPEPQGHVRVENLLYAYSANSQPIIRGLSFELEAGESLGIIGPTATGKTTLARLLVGNAIPDAGHVRFDGADIHGLNLNDRGRHLGYLPQDVELFEGTVTENIARMGEFDAQEVVAAAQAANVHDIILGLPDGYETNIGEGGAVLSGGTRQRIGLARALYGSPRMVVLDEPNASLDFTGDLALIESMDRLKERQTTTIIITHRPSILRNADRILVLYPDGRYDFGEREAMLNKVAAPANHANQSQREKAYARIRTA